MTAPWTNNVYRNVAHGNYMALDEYLDDVPELQQAVSPELLAVGTMNGALYGIPVQQLFPKSFGFNTRTELLERYDLALDPIAWFDDLTPVFERAVDGEGEGYYAVGGRIAATPEWFGSDWHLDQLPAPAV